MNTQILNTANDWNKLHKDVLGILKNKTIKEFSVTVTVECNDISENSDVLRLQSFFVLAKMMHENLNIFSTLHIILDDKSSDYIKKRSQIEQYICFQLLFHDYVQIHVNKTKLSKQYLRQIRFGRIVPLMYVNNSYNDKFYYAKLVTSGIEKNELSDFKSLCITYNNDSSLFGSTREKYNEIENNKYIYKDFNILLEKEKSNTFPLHKLFYCSGEEDLQELYIKLFLSNLCYTVTNIKGNKTIPLSKEDKNILLNDIFEYINKKCLNAPVIAQYIWSIFLRYMINDKSLLMLEGESTLNYNILEKSWYSALTYAEGYYQLIENSCIHSCGSFAFFSFRLYDVKRDVTVKQLLPVAETLMRLKNTYKEIEFNDSETYLEFSLSDYAINNEGSPEGMIQKYKKNRYDVDKVSDLYALFDKVPSYIEGNPEQYKNDIIHHYGLRTFEKIVLMNNGCFITTTPDDKLGYIAYASNGKRYRKKILIATKTIDGITEDKSDEDLNKEKESLDYFSYTESKYKVIVPVTSKWTNADAIRDNSTFNSTLPINSILDDYFPLYLNTPQSLNKTHDKIKFVSDLNEDLQNQIRKMTNADHGTENSIFCIDASKYDYYQIELLAKTIMLYIINHLGTQNRFAIKFKDKSHINEFVRIYSVFFEKTGGMFTINTGDIQIENTQIALCSNCANNEAREDNKDIEVNLILSGRNITDAAYSASLYSYYNSEASLDMIPCIEFLTRSEKITNDKNTLQNISPIFPFELYLNSSAFNEKHDANEYGAIEDNLLFFKHINNVLNTDMRTNKYGCKLEDVHVSIGSKIHIDSFYNAELLFHNYGNISRFAYIVAKDILKEHRNCDKNILLIGYETYSNLLIDQIKENISEYYKGIINCESLVFSSTEDEIDSERSGGLWPVFKEFINEKKISDYKAYTIIPIATTLSTIYKIQNISKRIIKKTSINEDLEFGKSTALILVGGISQKDDQDKTIGEKLGYWQNVSPISKTITIKKDLASTGTDPSIVTRYYFNPHANWHDPLYCDNTSSCTIGVDKTQTLPDAIFESYDNKKQVFANSNENIISKFWGKINYAHISDTENHYQYDIDYDKYYNAAKDSNNTKTKNRYVGVDEWLKTDVKGKIDHDAFNIVISPLDIENSNFLKSVLKLAFNNNARIFNIQINSYYKEDVRTKFNYITEEYKKIKSFSGAIKINVYYVDNCIVSGNTLQRGKQFMHMLLNDNEFSNETVELYKGIIVLTNRSSYETIHNILPKETLSRFFSFARLNVPSFNMHNGTCPSCELVDKYELMRKRSSTHTVSNEYSKLKEKHLCKDRNEYLNWLEYNIYKNSTFTTWFLQWLYYHVIPSSNYKEIVNIFGNNESLNLTCDLSHFINNIFNSTDNNKFHELDYYDQTGKHKDVLISFIKEKVISDRNYIRLMCTHEAFSELENITLGLSDFSSIKSKTRSVILKLFKTRFKQIDDSFEKNTAMWMKAEWLISYLKVLSRKQIGRYYHIRVAIYDILFDMARLAIEDNIVTASNKDIEFLSPMLIINKNDSSKDSLMPEMKLKVFMTVIRRLSAMHSSFVIDKTSQICNYFQKCGNQYYARQEYSNFYHTIEDQKRYHQHIKFPTEDEFSFNVAKLIKWTSMSAYDDSKCFQIETNAGNSFNSNDCIAKVYKLAFLENVQVIYNGLSRMLENYHSENHDFDNVHAYISKLSSDIKDTSGNYLTINPLRYFFEFMDLRGCHKNKCDETMFNIYTNMFLYFAELCNFSKQKLSADNPYKYEDLCNFIRDICEYDHCLFLYNDIKTYSVASSSAKADFLIHDIDKSLLDDLINKFKKTKKSQGYIASIFQKFSAQDIDNANLKYNFLVLNIPDIKNTNSGLYIVLYRKDTSSTCDDHEIIPSKFELIHSDECEYIDLWNVRNILFLRERIETIWYRDSIALKNMINNHDYIEYLGSKNIRTILHISDLHISTKTKSDMLEILNEKDLQGIKPDLLLISGDVIQGAYTAKQLIENYNAAIEVIKQIAIKIWGTCINGKCYIRGDWRKRIVISTGNHDYASMNELQAENKHRATLSGTLNGEPVSTMVKYSYFINFLREFLHMDIDEMVQHDLNEMITFKEMGLTIININTNSGVNPYRTNKVKVNTVAVDETCSPDKLTTKVIYIMHHTPLYNINYLDDIYYMNDRLKDNIYNKMKSYGDFVKIINGKSIDVLWIELLQSMVYDFKPPYNRISKDNGERILRAIVNEIYIEDRNWYNEQGLSDISYYLNSSEQIRETDDRCRQIKGKLMEHLNASEADQNNYIDFVKKHFDEVEYPYCILGGHTHQTTSYVGPYDGPLRNCKGIYEAAKFFDMKNNNLCYNIITIKDESFSFNTYNTKLRKFDEKKCPISKLFNT